MTAKVERLTGNPPVLAAISLDPPRARAAAHPKQPTYDFGSSRHVILYPPQAAELNMDWTYDFGIWSKCLIEFGLFAMLTRSSDGSYS